MYAHSHRLYFLLQRAAHRLQKIADRQLLAEAGVTTAQAAVLAILAGARGAKQRDVARQLGVNESAMTALSRRLVKMELIERQRDVEDPRAWQLTLTSTGKKAGKRAAKAFESINALLDEALSEAEAASLTNALNAIWVSRSLFNRLGL